MRALKLQFIRTSANAPEQRASEKRSPAATWFPGKRMLGRTNCEEFLTDSGWTTDSVEMDGNFLALDFNGHLTVHLQNAGPL
jgi:hypothetical protein